MALNVFTDGASRSNPGDAGIGIVIYNENKLVEEIAEFVGKRTNNEAEYLAVIRALEFLEDSTEKINLFSDSEFLVKQLNGEYKVKAKNIEVLFKKAKELSEKLDIRFTWVPREENKKADSLANQGIDAFAGENNQMTTTKDKLLLEKTFFAKMTCLKVQLNTELDFYFHLGLTKDSKDWKWEIVKMNDSEIGEIINLLKSKKDSISFYHKYDSKETQIWCSNDEKGFSIKVSEFKKNLNKGEAEVLRVILEEVIRRRNFK